LNTVQRKKPPKKIHPALARSNVPRVVAYALGSLLVLSALPPDAVLVKWIVAFFGFIYPTLFYQIAIRQKDTRIIGLTAYYVDAVLWALAVLATNFSIVILAVAPQLAVITGVLMLGPRRGSLSFLVMLVTLLIGQYFVEVEPFAHYAFSQAIYAWTLIMAFMFYITMLVNGTTRSFVATRHQLQHKNLQITQQAEQLESISKVAQLVNSTLDIDAVMHTIMERLNRIFDFSITAILFLDHEKQTLCLDRIRGDIPDTSPQYLQGLHIPLSEQHSAFTLTITTKKPVYLPDVSKDKGAHEGVSGEIFKLAPAKSLLTFPLSKDGEIQGVLAFANIDNFFQLNEANIAHIGQYVTYIESALRNASDYREIQKSRAAADAANKAKSQFLANMSHELRTPMNAVIGYSEMLEEEAEEQGLDDLIPDLQKIRSAGQHLLKLINDVLDLSKIEADKIELFPELFRAKDLLMDVEATAKPLVDKNDNRFEYEQLNEPGEVFLDQTKLRQVLLNLLSNAAKFTSDGQIRLTVKRELHGETDLLVVKVRDTGIGMTPEQLERVFDPFSQADASTTREYGGTGLGLTISRKFCEMMGGSLEAVSNHGKGSTFIMQIPTGTESHSLKKSSFIAGSNKGAKNKGPCVLVIDDDGDIQDLMQRLLSREGFQVISATNGDQGLQLAREKHPDVIILDVLMPGQDGWSVLNQIKADPDLADIPVVMQSTIDEPKKAFMLGASDYLTKPIDRTRIIDVVQRLKNLKNRQVLIVEDDIPTQTLLAEWLQRDGWRVHVANNGVEGLQLFLNHDPGLIILDLMMPKMDGFEFLDQVRHQPRAANTSIIVVTAKDLTSEDLERLNGGVERIIQKGDHEMNNIIDEIKRYIN
jgi:signal transduction histidine kinase/DNA-binding response OmpR family regulator/flagellin-specific chaperone FliS